MQHLVFAEIIDKSLLIRFNTVSHRNPRQLVNISRYTRGSTHFHVDTILRSRYSRTYIFSECELVKVIPANQDSNTRGTPVNLIHIYTVNHIHIQYIINLTRFHINGILLNRSMTRTSLSNFFQIQIFYREKIYIIFPGFKISKKNCFL